jgi:hypothetical protein
VINVSFELSLVKVNAVAGVHADADDDMGDGRKPDVSSRVPLLRHPVDVAAGLGHLLAVIASTQQGVDGAACLADA